MWAPSRNLCPVLRTVPKQLDAEGEGFHLNAAKFGLAVELPIFNARYRRIAFPFVGAIHIRALEHRLNIQPESCEGLIAGKKRGFDSIKPPLSEHLQHFLKPFRWKRDVILCNILLFTMEAWISREELPPEWFPYAALSLYIQVPLWYVADITLECCDSIFRGEV